MATSKSEAYCGECGDSNPLYRFGRCDGTGTPHYLCGKCADDLMLFDDAGSEFPEESHDDLMPGDPGQYDYSDDD